MYQKIHPYIESKLSYLYNSSNNGNAASANATINQIEKNKQFAIKTKSTQQLKKIGFMDKKPAV